MCKVGVRRVVERARFVERQREAGAYDCFEVRRASAQRTHRVEARWHVDLANDLSADRSLAQDCDAHAARHDDGCAAFGGQPRQETGEDTRKAVRARCGSGEHADVARRPDIVQGTERLMREHDVVENL